jgi:hypothetical protein
MIVNTRKHWVQLRKRRTGHALRRNDMGVDKILGLSCISLHYAVTRDRSQGVRGRPRLPRWRLLGGGQELHIYG